MRMRYPVVLLLLLLLGCQSTVVPATNGPATAGPATAGAETPGPATSSSPVAQTHSLGIAVFGDSIAAAANVAEAERWPTLLQAALTARDPSGLYTVHNFAQAKSRIDYTEQQVAAFDPKTYRVAILIIGQDDAGFVFPDAALVAKYKARVGDLIRALLAKGVQVLVGNPPPNMVGGKVFATPVADAIRKLAGDRLVELENAFVTSADPASLYSDGTQPNAAGQALISATFLQALSDGGYLK